MHWLVRWMDGAAGSTRTAVSTPAGDVTLGELVSAVAELADRLGTELARSVVAVRFPRGDPKGLVATLAAWRVGAVPLFMDIAAGSHPPLLVAAGARFELAPSAGAQLAVGSGPGLTASVDLRSTGIDIEAPRPLVSEAAYVISTSGSTAQPRLCVNRGASLRNTVLGLVDRFQLDDQARTLQFAPYNYDAWLGDALPTLWAGGVLIYGTPGPWSTFGAVVRRIHEGAVTHAVAPPSVWARLEVDCGLRVAVSAGEALAPGLARRLRGFADVVVNAYGPSEAAVCATTHICAAADDQLDSVPLGVPLPGVELDVVPTEREGVGLLRIRGAGVAAGYLGHDPSEGALEGFDADERGAYFQTSDLVREVGGEIMHVGRSDRAVKRHGRLVDLDRVEAAVRDLPDVLESVVFESDGRLVCQYASSGEIVDPGTRLGQVLEAWEVPQRWHRVGDFARGPSDKLLRGAYDERSPLDPVSEIWAEVLGRPPSKGSFFALGGDSTLAMELIAEVQNRCGVEVELADFVADPTLSFLLEQVHDPAEST